jgi:holo-[acyl-carrier protein] synthase
MIRGLGTDLAEIPRIRAAHARWGERFLRKVFVEEEIAYCLRRRDPAPHLAARFAAKEAGAKALGTGIARGVGWKQIYVTRERGRAPELRMVERAAQRLERFGPNARVHVTLTHSQELAQAFVVIESD